MDHRHFEDWLLKEEPLTPQQKRELNAHLKICRSCSALAEVDLALRSTRLAEPVAGFAGRFQLHLAQRKQALHRRNVLGFIFLILAVVGVLVVLLLPFLRSVITAPVDILTSTLSWLVALWASIQALFHAGVVLFRVAPGFVPAYIWGILLFCLSGWSLVWAFSLMRFTRYQRSRA